MIRLSGTLFEPNTAHPDCSGRAAPVRPGGIAHAVGALATRGKGIDRSARHRPDSRPDGSLSGQT